MLTSALNVQTNYYIIFELFDFFKVGVNLFKSISLCNAIYKLVSKVIVNTLCAFMPFVIHDSQSVFIKNILIIDNIIVAFEAFHSMDIGRINGSNYFAPKLNLSKAFDKIGWNFLGRL